MSSKIIQEGEALITIPTQTKISKKLPVFYNSVMKANRDISILERVSMLTTLLLLDFRSFKCCRAPLIVNLSS